MNFTTLLSVMFWIISGGIAGYVASLLLKARRMGCLTKILIGIGGAFIGGIVMNILLPGGLFPGISLLNQVINSTLGAIILLIVLEIILPGRQLGVDEGDDGGGRRRRR